MDVSLLVLPECFGLRRIRAMPGRRQRGGDLPARDLPVRQYAYKMAELLDALQGILSPKVPELNFFAYS